MITNRYESLAQLLTVGYVTTITTGGSQAIGNHKHGAGLYWGLLLKMIAARMITGTPAIEKPPLNGWFKAPPGPIVHPGKRFGTERRHLLDGKLEENHPW